MSDTEIKTISIVVPVYNEEQGIAHFNNELNSAISNIPEYRFQILYVDDGSTDKSTHLLEELALNKNHISLISFSRNFGHQAALLCGIKNSTGDAIISMDSDLQHPPSLIHELIKEWEKGFEVVNTIRIDEKESRFFKRVLSNLFYKLFNKLSDFNLQKSAADFRLISRSIIDVVLNEIEEKNVFLRGLISWMGFKQTSIEYRANKRYAGQTKFTIKKMFSLANTGFVYFSLIPIKIGLYLGIFLFSSSFIYLIVSVIYGLLTDTLVKGWTSLIFVILLISSFQFILIGILGLYIGHIFTEVKRRPSYIINKKIS